MNRPPLIALAIAGVLALVIGLVARGGEDGAPPDTLARLVPAETLLYAHLSTRPRDAGFARVAGELPPVARLRDEVLGALPGALRLERDVLPWLGEEAAFALVTPADRLLLATVADRARAEAAVGRLGDLATAPRHRGVPVLLAGATAVAFAGDVLAAGSEAAVRAAIDRELGTGNALAAAPAFARALPERPAGTTLALYASPRADLGRLGDLLARPGLEAVGATAAAEPGGLRVAVRLAGGAPDDAGFDPVLVERVPEGAVAYLGVRGAARLAALVERLGGAGEVESLRRLLADAAEVDLDADLLAPLAGEVALAVTGPGDDPEATSAGAPVITLKARSADPARTETTLARLQQPAEAFFSVPGALPRFEPTEIGGLQAFSLRATPELAPTYALDGDALILSTAPAGLAPPRGTVAAADAFRATVGEVPEPVESLLFVDLRQLLALGEQTGLTAIPGLGTARDDLARVAAAGLAVAQDPDLPTDTTAELFLQIP